MGESSGSNNSSKQEMGESSGSNNSSKQESDADSKPKFVLIGDGRATSHNIPDHSKGEKLKQVYERKLFGSQGDSSSTPTTPTKLDSCLIIGFMIEQLVQKGSHRRWDSHHPTSWLSQLEADSNPSATTEQAEMIMHDIMLPQNQLRFSQLEYDFSTTTNKLGCTLRELVLRYFSELLLDTVCCIQLSWLPRYPPFKHLHHLFCVCVAEVKKRISIPIIGNIPHRVRETRRSAYVPDTVSFGPYNYNLTITAEDKANAVERLCVSRDVDLTVYTRRLQRLIPQIRSYYYPERAHYMRRDQQLIPQIRSYYYPERPHYITIKDVYMIDSLVRNSCFIMELLLREGPFSGEQQNLGLIKLDMLVFENQIPFVVLEVLFDSLTNKPINRTLVQLIVDFFANYLPSSSTSTSSCSTSQHFFHLLHVFHSCSTKATACTSTVVAGGGLKDQRETRLASRSASELADHTSVQFKSMKNKSILFNKSFNAQSGVMELSPLIFTTSSDTLIRNLIGYEQHMKTKTNTEEAPVTTYFMLMGSLIRREKDLEVLRKAKILDYSNMGSGEAVLEFFSGIVGQTVINYEANFSGQLHRLMSEVQTYNDHTLNLATTAFIGLFTQANITSFVAFSLGTGVSTIGAVYAIKSYDKDNKK